jgi:hypothetical protein
MPTFYSPKGNAEVWAEKPPGYFTVAKWEADHAPPPPTPEQIAESQRLARIEEIRFLLARLDAELLTPRALAELAQGEAYALGKWQEHEAQAAPLRAELATLGG